MTLQHSHCLYTLPTTLVVQVQKSVGRVCADNNFRTKSLSTKVHVTGHSVRTSNSEQLCKKLLPTNSITAAPSILPFLLPVVPDQPQIRTSEAKPNPNVTATLIITLTLLTLLNPRCSMIGRYVAA